ncbi:MAG: sodium:proton antiporter [Gammaproteobacteria bacterium]|nr:sodium:proton antiporter [Gammaproteobacteria bacterium]
MGYVAIITVAGAFVAFALISRKIDGSMLTGPMLFAGLGLLVGPAALGLVPLQVSNDALHILAEITLVLVLFSDAAHIDLRQLRRDHNLPVRALILGMPLSIALGFAAAVMIFADITLWEAALLAAILVPTDAALGQAVVSNPRVPVRIRQALNVESGLNDGIALPVILIFAALASASNQSDDAIQWITFGVQEVTLGPLAGVVTGYLGAKFVTLCSRKLWMNEQAEGIIALGLAFGAFGLAEAIHGSGLIAAFVAGLTFGNTMRLQCAFLYAFAETEGQILVMLTFLAFGSAMLPTALATVTPMHLLYALLALTLVRMLPVSLSLLGTGIKPVTSLFLGWFGPRGLASVLFVLLVVEGAELAHGDTIFAAVIITVAMSIVLHGVSAGPGARWYGARTDEMGTCEENQLVAEEPFVDAQARDATA